MASESARFAKEQAEANERMMQEEERMMMARGGSPGMMSPEIPWDAHVPFVENPSSTLNWRVEDYKEETEVRENNHETQLFPCCFHL
jgi:hypothetical protein